MLNSVLVRQISKHGISLDSRKASIESEAVLDAIVNQHELYLLIQVPGIICDLCYDCNVITRIALACFHMPHRKVPWIKVILITVVLRKMVGTDIRNTLRYAITRIALPRGMIFQPMLWTIVYCDIVSNLCLEMIILCSYFHNCFLGSKLWNWCFPIP